MPSVHEQVSAQYAAFDMAGRGWRVFAEPVRPEPPFRRFRGYNLAPAIDDGRKATFGSVIVAGLSRFLAPSPPPPSPEPPEDEPEPDELSRDTLVELQTSLPAKLDINKELFEQFLRNLSLCREPVAFELIGGPGCVKVQFAAEQNDASIVRRQLQAYFPEAVFQPTEGTLETAWKSSDSEEMLVVEFGLEREFMFPLAAGKLDPFIGMVGALSELKQGDIALFQVLFESAREEWAESIVNSVTKEDGRPFFVNAPELASAAEGKVKSPLYAAVVRIAVKSESYERVVEIARDLASSLRVFAHPQGNKLIPLNNENYPFNEHVEDMLRRQSRRSGMLLNSDELIGFVHLPGSVVRSSVLERDSGKSKAAPAIAQNANGLLLGYNVHFGETIPVRLTPEQRVQHMHVIGASGTGKSTLLFNLIQESIENGEGVAVLDPHGDLVEQILGIIPPDRIKDVVLIDPSDEEYSVGFNILSAHSDLEKNLLASDLISVFQRLSTSWGDQMGVVLQNAILAFLESDQGGTLADLRRFLIEPAFRDKFLTTVRDPDIVYYWRKAFAQLSGNKSIGPALTRLETFLAPKPIRYMVTQKENRLDFGEIMDSGKIFLAKLPHGQMGKENSFLLGSLIVGKFQQLAMARQAQRIELRRPFFLYIDEFQNFITPSMAEILSGARKYRLGLFLAHQELHHLDRDRDVASAVLSNPYTRVVFRVSDGDAKRLADGFSFFEAKDLQNLGTGHAIARVERANGDFNLSVPLRESPNPQEAQKRRSEAITASRQKYAVSRKQLEAEKEALFAQSEEPKKERKPPPATPDSGLGDAEKPENRGFSPPPSFVEEPSTSKPKPQILESAPAPITELVVNTEPVAAAQESLQDKGIGGHQHNLIRERIEIVARKLGYTASREDPIGKGQKIDLVLANSERKIACEIAITTTIDHEVGNVAKCIRGGFEHIAVLSGSADRLQKIKTGIEAALPPEENSKVGFYHPDDFIKYLDGLSPKQAPAKTPKSSVSKVGKYTVKRRSAALSEEEIKARESETLGILTEAMQRTIKGK